MKNPNPRNTFIPYDLLVETQSRYIDFLHNEIFKYASTSKYQISNDDFRTGQEFRDQIEEMSAFLEK